MKLAFVHSATPQLPTVVGARHSGYWFFTLSDGSLFYAIACSHVPTMRLHFANHAPAANVLPAASSNVAIPQPTIAAIAKHTNAAALPTMTTNAALAALYAAFGDPILDPDGAT